MSTPREQDVQRNANKIKNQESLFNMLRGEKKELKLSFSADEIKDKSVDERLDAIYDIIRKIADKFAERELNNPQIFKS
jgi:hypothetical protein